MWAFLHFFVRLFTLKQCANPSKMIKAWLWWHYDTWYPESCTFGGFSSPQFYMKLWWGLQQQIKQVALCLIWWKQIFSVIKYVRSYKYISCHSSCGNYSCMQMILAVFTQDLRNLSLGFLCPTQYNGVDMVLLTLINSGRRDPTVLLFIFPCYFGKPSNPPVKFTSGLPQYKWHRNFQCFMTD